MRVPFHSLASYVPTFVHRRLSSLFGGMVVPIEIRVRQKKFRYFLTSFFFSRVRFIDFYEFNHDCCYKRYNSVNLVN